MNAPGETPEDEPIPHLSPEQIWSLIRRHMMSCAESAVKKLDPLEYIGPQVRADDYVEFCAQYLKKENVLTPDLLRKRLEKINSAADLKLQKPSGKRCCVAEIPVNYYGHELSDKEKENGVFLPELIVTVSDDEQNGLTERYGSGPSYIYNILPKEIREACSFTIPEYENKDPNVVTDTDRMAICKLYEEAYRNCQKIFNKQAPPEKTSN